MAESSKKSLSKLINHLLGLSHGEDSLQDYLEVLGETVKSDSLAILRVDAATGTARILGGLRLQTPVEEWQEQQETPFLAEQITGFPEVLVFESEGPYKDPFLEREGVASLLIKPANAGEEVLVIVLFRRKPSAYTSNEVERFAAVSGVVNTLILLHHPLKEQNIAGSTNNLTGLGLFSDFHQSMVKEISRARRGGGTVTMGIMSIDSHDPHLMEDSVLNIARAFQIQLRNFDTLDRYGSSELAFILPDLRSAESVRVLERVIRETASSLGDQVQIPDIYIGLSCYPEDGATVERLIEMAEAAMNKALEGSTPGVFRWTE